MKPRALACLHGVTFWAAGAMASVPQIISIGNEEVCGSFVGSRPSIAADSLNQPHIIIDQGWSPRLYVYHKINGTWAEALFAEGTAGGTYDASRLYLPHLEIDGGDRAWISCKLGTKEWGTMQGQGLWLLGNVATNPYQIWFRHVYVHKGNGNVSLDAAEPNNGVVLGTSGNWKKINHLGDEIASGAMNSGQSGEKIRFLISSPATGPGVWHSAMGGWSAQSSAYQNSIRDGQGHEPVTWAAYSTYPEQGDDVNHPAIGVDLVDPEVCYISVTYNPGVLINLWNGSNLVFSATNLPVIDPAGSSGVDRFGPQWTPAPGPDGGAFLTWTSGGRIKLVYVAPDGTLTDPFPGQGDPRDVCAGCGSAMCTDSEGNLHLAYVNGGMRYRKLEVQAEPVPGAPVAVLDAYPTEGLVPLTVNFDASGSYDADGTIVSYEWDFENDGTIDATGPATNHEYTPWGIYAAKLTVTDNDAKTDHDTVLITARAAAVSVDLGAIDAEDGVTHPQNADGDTTPVNMGGRDCRRNLDPGSSPADRYFYFAVDDSYALNGNYPEQYITIQYYDTGSGALELHYDSNTGDDIPAKYKDGGSVSLTGTDTWKQHTYHVTDAYFGNRQNAGADFRIHLDSGYFYLDVVQVSTPSVPPVLAEVKIPRQSDWTQQGVAIVAGGEGSWDKRFYGQSSPSTMVKKDRVYYLYYVGADGDRSTDGGPRRRALGVATSTDGINFTKYEGNPILTHLPHNNEEEGIGAAGSCLDTNGEVLVYYCAIWAANSTTESVQCYVALARSADGKDFTDLGYVLSWDDPSVWGYGDELGAEGAFYANGTYNVYYVAKGYGVSWGLGVGSGPARDNVSNTRGVLTDGQIIGGCDPVFIKDDTIALFIVKDFTDNIIEVRTANVDAPEQLSAPVETYSMFPPRYRHTVVFLDRQTSTWFMYQATDREEDGNAIIVRTAPMEFAASPPGQASDPSPAHQAVNVSVAADLSWTAGSGAESHDVYFGTSDPPEFRGNQTETMFDPGPMDPLTLHYWRIDAVNAFGTTPGELWQFTTGSVPGDFDFDGDVDQADFGHFQECLTGSGGPQTDPDCQDALLDGDNDVDLDDFAIFQACMSGPNVPANPNCAD